MSVAARTNTKQLAFTFDDMYDSPKEIKFRPLSIQKPLCADKHALICIIPEELENQALTRQLKAYYTGYRFPSTINLMNIRYFIPYIKGKGIRDIYQMRVIHAGTKHDLVKESKDRYMRLCFEFEFDRQLFDDYVPAVLKIWYTYTDAVVEDVINMNLSELSNVVVSRRTDNSAIVPMDKDEETEKDSLLHIENRRYIGCKNKLADWIFTVINSNIKDAHSFCDIFAGTGVIAQRAIIAQHITDTVDSVRTFDNVIINDFLYSNEVIYKAFFGNLEWNRRKVEELIQAFNAIDPNDIGDNYFSLNYGNRFFDINSAKKIGEIRQRIEDSREKLTEKEYCVLLASLIYSMDRIANTLGHFDAYIRKEISRKGFNMQLIDARCYENVTIYRQDTNELARHIHADVVYMDPPYNSRQYSRFYHVYETLIHWDNRPLFGVAMKPKEENMSDYCRSSAATAFADLVAHLDARYIAVSYNNTYNSKSSSSENKITLEQIIDTLQKCGDLMIYSQDYKAFDSGKTEMDDHQEYLFITKVDNEKRRRSFPFILRG